MASSCRCADWRRSGPAGAVIAPAFVVAYALVDRLVEDSVCTETNSWIITTVSVGGGAAAGLLVEYMSARAPLTVGGLLRIAVVPLLVASLRRTSRGSSAAPTPKS